MAQNIYFIFTEKSLKQESILQEDTSSFPNTDGETPDCEVEQAKPDAQSFNRTTQVVDVII